MAIPPVPQINSDVKDLTEEKARNLREAIEKTKDTLDLVPTPDAILTPVPEGSIPTVTSPENYYSPPRPGQDFPIPGSSRLGPFGNTYPTYTPPAPTPSLVDKLQQANPFNLKTIAKGSENVANIAIGAGKGIVGTVTHTEPQPTNQAQALGSALTTAPTPTSSLLDTLAFAIPGGEMITLGKALERGLTRLPNVPFAEEGYALEKNPQDLQIPKAAIEPTNDLIGAQHTVYSEYFPSVDYQQGDVVSVGGKKVGVVSNLSNEMLKVRSADGKIFNIAKGNVTFISSSPNKFSTMGEFNTSQLPPVNHILLPPPEFDSIVKAISQYKGDIRDLTGNLPGIKSLTKQFIPSAIFDKPELTSLVARMGLFVNNRVKTVGAMRVLDTIGSVDKVFWKRNADDIFTEGPFKGMSFGDMIEKPHNFPFDKRQKLWLSTYKEIVDNTHLLMQKAGLDVTKLPFGEGGMYSPRGGAVVKMDTEGNVIAWGWFGKVPPGAKISSEKARAFVTREDALRAGYHNMRVEDALSYHVQSSLDRIVDKNWADWLMERLPMREGSKPKFGEVSGISVAPAFSGRVFTTGEAAEAARNIKEMLGRRELSLLRNINSVQSIAKQNIITMNLGHGTVHLFIQMFAHPVEGPKAIIPATIESLFSKAWTDRFLAENNDVLQNSHHLLLANAGTVDYSMYGYTRVAPLRIYNKVMQPFSRAFATALDVSGIMMWKALEPLMTTPERQEQVEQAINELRGLSDSSRLGVSPNVRALESLPLLAPRYTRATAALLTDYLAGNLRGQIVRQSTGRALASLTFLTIAIGMAKGESPEEMADHFNPTSSNFFSWRVGDVNVGLGGKIRSTIRYLAQVATNPLDMPSLTEQFYRNQASPFISSVIDIAGGRDYNQQESRDTWIHALRTLANDNLTNIAINGMLNSKESTKDKLTESGATFFGLRALPASAFTKWQEYVAKQEGKKYEEVDDKTIEEYKKGILPDGTEIPSLQRGKELWERFRTSKEERGQLLQVQEQLENRANERIADFQKIQVQADSGIPKYELRTKISNTNSTYHKQIEQIQKSFSDDMEKLRSGKQSTLDTDVAFNDYMKIVTDPTLHDDVEGPKFDTEQIQLDNLRARVGDEVWANIQDRLKLSRQAFPDVVKEYYTMLDATRPYWDSWKDNPSFSEAQKEAYTLYSNSNSSARTQMLKDIPGMKNLITAVNATRMAYLRSASPEIQQYMADWYGKTTLPNRVPVPPRITSPSKPSKKSKY